MITAYYVSDRIAIMFRGSIIELGSASEVLMNPKHPYTQILKASVPEADPKKRWKEAIRLSDIEYEEYQRKGCKFAGRCPKVMDICKEETPPSVTVDDVIVKCFLYKR